MDASAVGEDRQNRVDGRDPDNDPAVPRKSSAAGGQEGGQGVGRVDQDGPACRNGAAGASLHQQVGADQDGADAKHPENVQHGRVGLRIDAQSTRQHARRQQRSQSIEKSDTRQQDAGIVALVVDRGHCRAVYRSATICRQGGREGCASAPLALHSRVLQAPHTSREDGHDS